MNSAWDALHLMHKGFFLFYSHPILLMFFTDHLNHLNKHHLDHRFCHLNISNEHQSSHHSSTHHGNGGTTRMMATTHATSTCPMTPKMAATIIQHKVAIAAAGWGGSRCVSRAPSKFFSFFSSYFTIYYLQKLHHTITWPKGSRRNIMSLAPAISRKQQQQGLKM